MDLAQSFAAHESLLMEGALGERLKREYGLAIDGPVAMAGLVYTKAGRQALRELWTQYSEIARRYGLPFLATTPTRRANTARAGERLPTLLRDNVRFLREVLQGEDIYIGGLMGCKGDAYTGAGALSSIEARAFHEPAAQGFAEAGVDFLYAGIMPTLPEAVGMAETMAQTGLPYLISFTIQDDGRLIDGTTIHDAITTIDDTVKKRPLCFMANCVHPDIVYKALSQPFNRTDAVYTRFLGIQANTSPLPYAALDGATELHCAEPEEFAEAMLRLKRDMHLKIMGGCCGTDARHMEAVARGLI